MGGTATPFEIVRWENGEVKPANPESVETENPIEHFVRCIRGETEPRVTPEETLTMLKILDALFRSAASGTSELV